MREVVIARSSQNPDRKLSEEPQRDASGQDRSERNLPSERPLQESRRRSRRP